MGRTEFDKLMEHEYDGIREYDNPLPSWWTGIFVACIVFAVGYWLFYHWGGPGLSEIEDYREMHAAHLQLRAAEDAKTGKVDEATLAKLASTPTAIATGETVFAGHCVPCHNKKGQGLVGPNLTDEYQLHGSTRVDIYNTIHNGVPQKGMQSWAPILKPAELMAVAAYVSTLRGTNVAGKAPQGEKVGPLE